MDFDQLLLLGVRDGASDIMLKTGSIPKARKKNDLVAFGTHTPISPETMMSWIKQMLPSHLKARFESSGEIDFSYVNPQGQRFRVNLFRQRQTFSAVLRVINNHIKTLEELMMPEAINNMAKLKRGLVLVTGATGSGKSTTLAALVDKVNRENYSHIVTVEDPIEYWFKDKNSTINQREIGVDTQSFSKALRAALRQNPDVILVGELRDKETIETALMAAETGHLVFSTLHTNDAVETITRFMSYFPAEQEKTIKLILSQTLKGIVSQRLVPKKDGQGMIAAAEIMMVNALIRDIIINESTYEAIADAIRRSRDNYGMQSFDQSLIDLYEQNLITYETAVQFASNRDDIILQMQGIAS